MVTASVRASHAADWALSHGISALTTSELADLLDIPAGQVRQRLAAPTRRGEWASPARGLWMPVTPEFRTWGAPQGSRSSIASRSTWMWTTTSGGFRPPRYTGLRTRPPRSSRSLSPGPSGTAASVGPRSSSTTVPA